ncbi:MAG: hypothetical protein KBS63_00375 [Clostridiales bacterium]|nr:hypothetical protein [Candidatus Crickella caballi]
MSNKAKSGLSIVLSLLIAFAAWVFVIINYYPTKDVTFHSVPIVFQGEDNLAYSNLAVEKASDESVDVTLNIKRSEIRNISDEDIQIIADVSDAEKGSNTIKIDVLPPEGASVVKKSRSTVNIAVDICESKTIDVAAVFGDASENGEEPVLESINSSTVVAYGTSDNLDRVSCAALRFKSSELAAGSVNFEMAPVALDNNGETVPHIVFYPRTVKGDAFAGVTKTVKLKLNISDNLIYEKDITAPEKITVKGSSEALEKINQIETEVIDLNSVSKDCEIALRYKLPEGVNIAQASLGEVLTVTAK